MLLLRETEVTLWEQSHKCTLGRLLCQGTNNFLKQNRYIGRKMEERIFLVSMFSFVLIILYQKKLSMNTYSTNNHFLREFLRSPKEMNLEIQNSRPFQPPGLNFKGKVKVFFSPHLTNISPHKYVILLNPFLIS